MADRRTVSLPRRAPRLALALALVAAPVPAFAAPGEGDFEQLLAEADGHALDGRPDEALTAYEKAFEAMPPELRATEVGELVVLAAGKAALDDYERNHDVESLRRGRALLIAFITEVSSRPDAPPPPLDSARARLDEIDAAIPEAEPATPPPAPAVTTNENAEPTSPEPMTDDAPRRRPLGLALAASGGVVALGGVALVVAGTQQVPWFERKMEEIGWTPDHPEYADEAARAERMRAIDIGVGAAVAVVGVGLGVTGAVLIARDRKARSNVALSGAVGPDGALLTARLRF